MLNERIVTGIAIASIYEPVTYAGTSRIIISNEDYLLGYIDEIPQQFTTMLKFGPLYHRLVQLYESYCAAKRKYHGKV